MDKEKDGKNKNGKEKGSVFIFLAFIVAVVLAYFVGFLVGRNAISDNNIASVQINQESKTQTYQPLVITPSPENVDEEDDMQPVDVVVNTTIEEINDSSQVAQDNIRYKQRRTSKPTQNKNNGNNTKEINTTSSPSSDNLDQPANRRSEKKEPVSSQPTSNVKRKFTVQVYSHDDEVLAYNNAKKLSDMGFKGARVDKGQNVFKVRIGLFDSKDEAEKVKEKLKDHGIKDAFIYHYR